MDVIEYKHLSDANYLKVQLRKAKNENKKYFKIMVQIAKWSL